MNRKITLLFTLCLTIANQLIAVTLSSQQKKEIAKEIWLNEGSGRYDRLVFWKTNENFPSLGIAHFIWYPHKQADIYTQTFPDLLRYFKKKKVKLPSWLDDLDHAPWKTKEEFDKVQQGIQVQELRKLLFDTMDLQLEFILQRLEKAWARILQNTAQKDRVRIKRHYKNLMQSAQGTYTLIDYLNFKGEGTDPKERYNGAGWGLLQVLQAMPANSTPQNAVALFAQAAKEVLSQRINNAPICKKHEKDWLQGWHNRINRYTTVKF